MVVPVDNFAYCVTCRSDSLPILSVALVQTCAFGLASKLSKMTKHHGPGHEGCKRPKRHGGTPAYEMAADIGGKADKSAVSRS